MLFDILLTFGLVFLNGFFVASEFAIVKVRSSQMEVQKAIGGMRAKVASEIVNKLDAYLAATQLGITIASLGLGWIGEPVVSKIIIKVLNLFNIQISAELTHQIALPTAFILITFLHIVFGELAPKSIAIRYPTKTTLWLGAPLKVFYYLFLPLIWLLNGLSIKMLKIIGITPVTHSEIHSEEEIKVIIEESNKSGVLEKDQTVLLHNVFDFGDLQVKQIMVPRGKIFAIDIDKPREEIIEEVIDEGYSRIPVYKGDLNNIIGVLHSKDLLRLTARNIKTNIREILRPVHMVVINKLIDDLLHEFQSNHIHLAVAVNEFGETEGIVTLEDIIEKLVGEIQDEFDDEKPTVIKKSENIFIVNALESVVDINKHLPEPLPESDSYVTLAGLINDYSQKIPSVNEIIHFQNYRFKILKVKNNIELVHVTWLTKEI